MKNFTKKSVSYLKSKDFENRADNVIWKSSIGGIKKRPSSAQSAQELRKTTTVIEERKPAPLFLNYSKLIAIEASLEHDRNNDIVFNERPMTTLANYLNPTDKEVEKDDISDEINEENKQPEIEVNWLELPDEIWLKILSSLQHVDLVRIGATCKKLNQLYNDNSLCKSYIFIIPVNVF